jgi:hypothetical protein
MEWLIPISVNDSQQHSNIYSRLGIQSVLGVIGVINFSLYSVQLHMHMLWATMTSDHINQY